MKRLIALLFGLLLSCSPIVHEMPDKQAYDSLMAQYDSRTGYSEFEYEELDDEFGRFSDDYSFSSYCDNTVYYRGRINQHWAEELTGEDVIDQLDRALLFFRKLDDKSGQYVDGLSRIGEVLDRQAELGADISKEQLIAAYQAVVDISPKSTKGIAAAAQLELLQ